MLIAYINSFLHICTVLKYQGDGPIAQLDRATDF